MNKNQIKGITLNMDYNLDFSKIGDTPATVVKEFICGGYSVINVDRSDRKGHYIQVVDMIDSKKECEITLVFCDYIFKGFSAVCNRIKFCYDNTYKVLPESDLKKINDISNNKQRTFDFNINYGKFNEFNCVVGISRGKYFLRLFDNNI